MEWGTSHGVVQCGSVLVLLALTEGMGGLFDSIYTYLSLWETWEFLESGVLPFLSSLVPYIFSCSPTGPSFALFHNKYSSFPPFSYRDPHFSYSCINMKGHLLEKMWEFLSQECIAKCLSKRCH